MHGARRRTCEQCGGSYLPKRRWQRFCDGQCRDDWHNERKKAARANKAADLASKTKPPPGR